MRNYITYILLGLSFLGSAQNEKKVEKLNLDGLIIFKFIPDNKFEGYYCSLKPEILVDSTKFDFVSNRAANYDLLKENPEFIGIMDIPEIYLTDIETNLCVYSSRNCKYNFVGCDSILEKFRLHNIYDTLLYKPHFDEHMTLSIYSNSIYKCKNSDTICIVLSFTGTVVKYENILFGAQTDFWMENLEDGSRIFDDSHSTCPFEKYNSTFLVIECVDRLERLNENKIDSLKLLVTDLKKLKVFLYE